MGNISGQTFLNFFGFPFAPRTFLVADQCDHSLSLLSFVALLLLMSFFHLFFFFLFSFYNDNRRHWLTEPWTLSRSPWLASRRPRLSPKRHHLFLLFFSRSLTWRRNRINWLRLRKNVVLSLHAAFWMNEKESSDFGEEKKREREKKRGDFWTSHGPNARARYWWMTSESPGCPRVTHEGLRSSIVNAPTTTYAHTKKNDVE